MTFAFILACVVAWIVCASLTSLALADLGGEPWTWNIFAWALFFWPLLGLLLLFLYRRED